MGLMFYLVGKCKLFKLDWNKTDINVVKFYRLLLHLLNLWIREFVDQMWKPYMKHHPHVSERVG